MNANEFLEQVRDSRLLPADLLEQIADGLSGEGSSASLAGALMAEGLLTPFQVKKVLGGEARQLQLGQYRLLDELGKGGMGQVFKAHHTVMGRTVAIKVLAPDLQGDEQALQWFEREVRMITQLQHPNIVLAYDANEVNGVHFLVMEYVEGQNLQAYVKKEGPLPVAQACEMMFQAAMALQYAHELGMVHRDIKPANLLVPVPPRADTATEYLDAAAGSDQELRPCPPVVKIVDFGLARLRSTAPTETIQLKAANNFAGTPDYVSPEQCRDVHAVDIRSDLYSLGCTFYFALTGSVPFAGDSVMAKLASHLVDPPPPVEESRPDVPPRVAAIVRQLLEKKPDDRFQTPLALARALQPWCASPGAVATPGLWPMDYFGALPPNVLTDTPSPAGNRRLTDRLPAIQTNMLAVVPGRSGSTLAVPGEATGLKEHLGTRMMSRTPGNLSGAAIAGPTPAFANGVSVVSLHDNLQRLPPEEVVEAAAEPGSSTDMIMQSAVEFGLAKKGSGSSEAQAAKRRSWASFQERDVGEANPSAGHSLPCPSGRTPKLPVAPRTESLPPQPAMGAIVADGALGDGWRLWTDIIAALHAGRGPGNWDDPRYRQLHAGLLARCRHEAGAGPEDRCVFFRQLQELVKPWISLEILAHTEPELLGSLLAQCRRAEEVLGVRRSTEHLGRWVRLLAGSALVVWLAGLAGRAVWLYWSAPSAGAMRHDWRAALAYLQIDSVTGLAWVVLPVAILTAVVLLFRRP